MSDAIIVGAIQKLESFLVETPSICTCDELIVKDVINELGMMVDFLSDKKSGKRSRLNYLVAEFAEMAQLSADLTRSIERNFFYDEIFKARYWLRNTKKRIMRFGVGGGETETRPKSVGEEGVVVGLEEDVHQLVGRVILNEKSDLVISCIKGMLGVGKTTLARQVYNHAAVVAQFERRAWVRLSSDTSIKEVLLELILQLVLDGGEEPDGDSLLLEEMGNRSLRQMLSQNLQKLDNRSLRQILRQQMQEMDTRSLRQLLSQNLRGMPYFIVVDNVLKGMRLASILEYLPDEGHGSRLLFTSCYRIIQDAYYTHEMKPLDSDKSWQLFLKTIFHGDKFTSDENKFSKDLERKGREMLKKCGGLPVAIIDVGLQKAKQRLSGIEWEQLFDSIDLGESLKLLEPMYHRLDEQLKECFLHISFFKENAIMREEKLEQIWVVRGLNTRRSVSCTYDLVSESIIEVVHEFRREYEVKRCRINPLLHMLSIKIAEEKMGFEILRSNGNSRFSEIPRHLVIYCSREKFNHSTDQDKHLFSLIFHGGGSYLDDASPSYWKSLELLNILDMDDFGVKTLSQTIGTLIELRYLGLRNNYIQEIPHSFGGLKKLETLDIALNFMVEVSDIIGEMDSLRHLYMSNVICRKPLNIDALQNLETLTYISIYDWTYEVSSLENMSGLHKLGIEEVDENSDISKLIASLAKLENLKRLTLRGYRFKSMLFLDELGILSGLHELKLDGLLARLPNNFPPNITYLVLVNTCLDEDPMLVLQYLEYLEVLKLRNAYTGRQMVIPRLRFYSLEVLRIDELWNLRNIRVEEGGMRYLNQLEIKNCPHLETLPEEIGSMRNMRKLKMVTTKHIATKIRNSSLISKIVEVDISPTTTRSIGRTFFYDGIFKVGDWLRNTKKRMMEIGVGGGETEMRPQSVEEEYVVVGLEEDVRQLIDRAILNEEWKLVMSCIKGMFGVGKTTLAKQVYNHADVVARFGERRAWVSLSSDTSIKELLVELVRKLVVGGGDGDSLLLEEMDYRNLRKMLHKHLRGKRYFIVVDNLLREMRLESFLDGLPQEGHGSRLLFTSRYKIEIIPDVYYTHEMKPLDSDNSWQLFLKTIFRGDKFTSDEKIFSKDLERKGREMLRKCGGLPVAIIDVGRHKAKQRLSGIEWEELFDSIDLGESLKLLEPMYHRLDEQLKECFLHMSFFKENAIMRVEKLEQIWAVRELNTQRSISSMYGERISESCIYALVRESIIEVAHDFRMGCEVKRCRINPLLHMLSIKKAEEKMGFEILRSNGNSRFSQFPHHRVIYCSRDMFNHSTNQDEHVVSLIFHGGGSYLDDARPSYWESFKQLKILDMDDFGVKTLSETIGTLMELRYLGLRNNYIQEFPHSFGGLKKLETLDIALNFLVEVPDIITEMDSLRHLYMSNVICRKPLKIDALRNLETLTYVSIFDVSTLEMMIRLHKLGIEEVDENSDVRKLIESLAGLPSFKRLNLRGFRFKSMPCLDELGYLGYEIRELKLDGLLARLPNNFPPNISYLVLVNTCLDEDPMPELQYLKKLEVLKLQNAYTGRQMVIPRFRFGSLKVLRINELWNLGNVQVEEGAMRKLEQLEIKNCPHLETFSEEIGSMKHLKMFEMVTTKHIATKIRNSSLISKIMKVNISP